MKDICISDRILNQNIIHMDLLNNQLKNSQKEHTLKTKRSPFQHKERMLSCPREFNIDCLSS